MSHIRDVTCPPAPHTRDCQSAEKHARQRLADASRTGNEEAGRLSFTRKRSFCRLKTDAPESEFSRVMRDAAPFGVITVAIPAVTSPDTSPRALGHRVTPPAGPPPLSRPDGLRQGWNAPPSPRAVVLGREGVTNFLNSRTTASMAEILEWLGLPGCCDDRNGERSRSARLCGDDQWCCTERSAQDLSSKKAALGRSSLSSCVGPEGRTNTRSRPPSSCWPSQESCKLSGLALSPIPPCVCFSSEPQAFGQDDELPH